MTPELQSVRDRLDARAKDIAQQIQFLNNAAEVYRPFYERVFSSIEEFNGTSRILPNPEVPRGEAHKILVDLKTFVWLFCTNTVGVPRRLWGLDVEEDERLHGCYAIADSNGVLLIYGFEAPPIDSAAAYKAMLLGNGSK